MEKTVIVSPKNNKNLTRELKTLCSSIGLQTIKVFYINPDIVSSAWLIGSGKAIEIIEWAIDNKADVITLNMELSPSQQRNWERAGDFCVIDRQEVILEIFSQRAVSREALLQIGLARMEYSLPRLTRAWTHLSRQRGGTKGNRGEGETQLEIDKRLVLTKISKIKKELSRVEKQRAVQRAKRTKEIVSSCIVGYTNAGKSSLLNKLCNANVISENKLFASLDSTTRLLKLPGGTELALSDTIGFIRNLPHKLIQAFHSSLEEVVLAEFLIIVVDSSDPDAFEQYKTTIATLKEIGAENKDRLIVFNKIDKLKDKHDNLQTRMIQQEEKNYVFLSVKTGSGLSELLFMTEKLLRNNRTETTFVFPANSVGYKNIAYLHRTVEIIYKEYTDTEITIKAICPENIQHKFKEYII